MVDTVRKICDVRNIKVATIHAGMEMTDRSQEWNRFMTSDVPMIISTNLLSRGVQMSSIRIITNYELPTNAKTGQFDHKAYQNRLRRCNHLGSKGLVINLVCKRDDHNLHVIRAMNKMEEIFV